MTKPKLVVFFALILCAMFALNRATAQQEVDLKALQSACENARLQIGQNFVNRRDDALARYGRALDSLMDSHRNKGDLDTYLVLDEEKARFSAEQTVPDGTDFPSVLGEAVRTCNKAIETVSAERSGQTAALLKRYVTALDELIRRDMQNDNMEEAKAAKAERDRVASELEEVEAAIARAAPPRTEPESPEPGSSNASVTASVDIRSIWQIKKSIPSSAKEFRGHHYLFIETKKEEPGGRRGRHFFPPRVTGKDVTWTEAQADCEKRRGHLAIMKDAATLDFVRNMAKLSEGKVIWIGLRKKEDHSPFQWVDGTDLQFAGWANSYQPQSGSGLRHVAFGNHHGVTGWFSSYDRNSRVTGYVCEWDY